MKKRFGGPGKVLEFL